MNLRLRQDCAVLTRGMCSALWESSCFRQRVGRRPEEAELDKNDEEIINFRQGVQRVSKRHCWCTRRSNTGSSGLRREE